MVDPAPWLRGKLGDFFTISREKGVEDLPTLSVTMRNGLVRRDSIDRKMDSERRTAIICASALATLPIT